jgi:hypothetical protein
LGKEHQGFSHLVVADAKFEAGMGGAKAFGYIWIITPRRFLMFLPNRNIETHKNCQDGGATGSHPSHCQNGNQSIEQVFTRAWCIAEIVESEASCIPKRTGALRMAMSCHVTSPRCMMLQ